MSLNNPEVFIHRLKDKFPTVYRELYDRRVRPSHIAYVLINHDATLNHVPWNKCLDCGQPYVIGESDSNSTFCSDKCEEATRIYLGL